MIFTTEYDDVELSPEEITKKMTYSRGELAKLIEYNNTFISNINNNVATPNDAYYYVAKNWRSNSRGYNHTLWSYAFSKDRTKKDIVSDVQKSIEIFGKIIDCTHLFEKRWTKNTLKEDDCLPTIESEAIESEANAIRLIVYRVPLATTCNQCDKKVKSSSLVSHQKTDKCKTGALLKKYEDSNLILTNNLSLIAAAKRGDIDHEKRPIKFDWYVPKWAIDALNLYNKGGDSPYGGMTFAEFVGRFKPGDKHG